MNTLILVSIAGALLGIGVGYWIRQTIGQRRADSIEAKIKNQLEEARNKARETILAAKDKAVAILDEAKNEEKDRKKELAVFEEKITRREEILNQRLMENEKKNRDLDQNLNKLRQIKTRVEELRQEAEKEVEKSAGLTQKEAKEVLFQKIEQNSHQETTELLKKLEHEKRDEIEKQALEIMRVAIQRFSRSSVGEITTSFVTIPDEEMKGKIIGREGRNIRTLERLTGVDIIIDESPDTITLSSFDPIRRETAKLALEKLIKDGRIQPARIEEKIEEAKKEINEKIKDAGENAVYEIGILDLPKEIIYLLGRLNYRSSYGQNVLQHSIEAAHLAGMIAAELGGNVEISKKAALLHDIGKAIDHEVEGTHVELGRRILQKYGLSNEIIKAIEPHHEDYPFETPESYIVAAAEAISAGRPGARRDSLDNYLKRLEELEKLAASFSGVEKAYAIQAGRELRVFVVPEKIDDLGALNLAKDISAKIQEELNYPGEIKVTVIRETRAVEYAR
ncbi:MAG TPA: ribonuclease Y [Candidatus Paceibacterota bacterium]|nr:ribonuclease Y [Candidatus Paceibacterota bacterium]